MIELKILRTLDIRLYLQALILYPKCFIFNEQKKFMTCFMETFSYVKIFYIEFNKEIFPGDLSQTLSKPTWANFVRNILTINYLPCTSRKIE